MEARRSAFHDTKRKTETSWRHEGSVLLPFCQTSFLEAEAFLACDYR
jgi:hypothetical protein